MNSETAHQRVLVTGAGGQLGTALRRRFGEHVIALDLPDLDITDRAAVCGAMEHHAPHVVINAAAFTQVDLAETEPKRCHAVNVRGVENLVAECQRSGALMVQISTDYVFDGRQSIPYTEAIQPNPLNVYGRSKLEAERLVTQSPYHLIIRTAGLFGPGGPTANGNFVDSMLQLAGQGRPLRVVDDQMSSYTCTSHLAAGIATLVASNRTGVFHLTNTGAATWYEVARETFRVANLSVRVEPIPMAEYPRPADRPRFSVLDTSKYAQIPGHFPMPTWQEAVGAYVGSRH